MPEESAVEVGITLLGYHPFLLEQLAVALDESAVHAEHDWMFRVGVIGLHGVVEVFCLCLSDSVVVVHGTGEEKVLTLGQIDTLSKERRVEDDLTDEVKVCHTACTATFVDLLILFAEPLLGEVGYELLTTVVMMYAVGEPYAFEIDFHLLELIRFLVLGILIDIFEYIAHLKVVLAVLVEEDVASPESCLTEVVDECLLFQGKVFEALDLVTEHLKVSKTFIGIDEVVFCLLNGFLTATQTRHAASCK